MATCPEGHTSASTDYCDVCGAPMPVVAPVAPSSDAAGAVAAPTSLTCPNCHAANPAGALFCEACGYDFTTGSLPRMSSLAPAAPAGLGGLGGATAVRDLPPSVLAPAAAPVPPPVANPFDLDAAPAAPVPAPAAPVAPSEPAPGPVVAATPLDAEPLAPPAPTASLGDDIVDADVIEEPAADPVVPAAVVAAPDVPAPDVPDWAPPVAAAAPAWSPAAPAPAPAVSIPAPAVPIPAPLPVPEPVPAAPAASALQTPVPPPFGLPAPAQAAPTASELPVGKAEWVAEVWIDPDWYAGQQSPDQLPSPGLPRVVGLRKRASLVGRPSKSRGIVPDVDCEPDTGVSRRHAELTTDGKRWWVEDLGSSNGTYVGQAGSPLPVEPIAIRTELGEDARVYVGSWTRVVVRRANPDEVDL